MDNEDEMIGDALEAVTDGEKAYDLQQDGLWSDIIDTIKGSLEVRALACDTSKHPEQAADILRCKQLMAGIEREIETMIQNGRAANEFILKEMERKKTLMDRALKR